MAAVPFKKIEKLTYLSNGFTDLHQIRHDDACSLILLTLPTVKISKI